MMGEAKEQSQQQILSDIATGAAFECSGDRDCLAKDHGDDCQYDPGYEADEGYPALNQGLFPGWERSPKCIHDSKSCCSECRPAEPNPAPECTCTWDSEDRGGGATELVPEVDPDCPTHGLEACKVPDPAPEIPESWDLITAGDVGHFWNARDGWWVPVGGTARLSTAQILAMGQVRRAVIVTLPDGWTIDQVRMLAASMSWQEGEK